MRYLLFFLPWLCFAVLNPANRPSKAPFISGDAFRAYSDHCYDELDTSLCPCMVQKGDTIFVKTDYLSQFFQKIHPRIHNRYILITHNSDDPSPGEFRSYLDDEKIIVWFAQNYDGYVHPKIEPIPMGIANFCWEHGNATWIERMQQEKWDKIHLAHMQMSVQNFAEERISVKNQFSRASYCYTPPKRPFRLYLIDLASSKFEIAPRGHAYDTHRIWESLYLDTIPIVKTSPLDPLYRDLPILIIEDWKQVTETFLKEKYQEYKKQTFRLEKIWMDYWIHLMNEYKNQEKDHPLIPS